MYVNMKIGQRHEFVSRFTTASVDMHWQANTKNTMSESAESHVKAGVPSGRRALRSFSRRSGDASSASPKL